MTTKVADEFKAVLKIAHLGPTQQVSVNQRAVEPESKTMYLFP
jgi:hypothetical protein